MADELTELEKYNFVTAAMKRWSNKHNRRFVQDGPAVPDDPCPSTYNAALLWMKANGYIN